MADQPCARIGRRTFLKAAAAAPLGLATIQSDAAWRTFEVVVSVDVLDARGSTRVWLPLPSSTAFQRVDSLEWNAGSAAEKVVTRSGAKMLLTSWRAGAPAKTVTLTMRVSTRNHRVSLSGAADHQRGLPANVHEQYVRPTRWIPTDGIVRTTALRIVSATADPLQRARAIYEWIVENTFRDAAVKGCGTGDIRWMLESGSLGGKCADLNALFVGLCRAVGLAARDWYGIRVASSQLFRSLGRTGDITTAQHCRAEVFIDGIGWLPVDPADVRKVVLEERPGASLSDADVTRARRQFFGGWEMNWIAFNEAHDVSLPDSNGKMLPFLMYPQAEVSGMRRDSLDPQRFQYHITSREVV